MCQQMGGIKVRVTANMCILKTFAGRGMTVTANKLEWKLKNTENLQN